MAKVEIKVNYAAVGALLKGGEIQGLLGQMAEAIAADAGEGMEASTWVGPRRASARVITATTEARLAEAHHRALTAAFTSGRR